MAAFSQQLAVCSLASTEIELSIILMRANRETLDMLAQCAAVPASSAMLFADIWAAQAANLRALLAQAALAVSITEGDHSHA
jgi:hypothetical protein